MTTRGQQCPGLVTYLLEPQVGLYDLVDFILERFKLTVSGNNKTGFGKGASGSPEAPYPMAMAGGSGTYHLHQLRHGHLKLDDDWVGHIGHRPDDLVVVFKQLLKQAVLRIGGAGH